ncbi:hypothetical protein M758_10G185300 [Ceratodon purpureus]|uniref:Rab-GAP TBC domain-containing protein n=1 Tax=Ceratodon purpureus TaxID=3225 RepID=A0A8T0GQT3_CERPU|nr:hypothetical protein KC19_10G190000 [Ceratodon purpureus]KAG0604622.1 hypothetical protein M758_10G185300 [Ceratodon purpureus]
MKPPVPDARAAPGPAPAGGVFNVDRTNSLNQTLRKVTGLLGVGRILGRKDSNGEASTSDRGAEDCSPTDSGGPSLTESKSFASDASDGNGEPCVASPSYPFDTSSRGIGSENSRLPGGRATDAARVARFKKILAAQSVDVDALRELAWSGVPPFLRPTVWRLLLGYASPNADRRDAALARKRQEYMDCVPQYYDIPDADRTEDEIVMLHQIGVDAPRTLPEVPFFQEPVIQTTLKRILYIWAIRHPASGYVQGINDLATPFIVVFLSEYLEGDIDMWDLSKLSPGIISKVEADSFGCLSKLLDGIQDHYTFAQPGIQRLVFRFKELVRRIDEPVAKHLEQEGLEFLQFSFRWLNCLLIREIPFQLVGRLWDTWLAEADNFPEYLVYVCASFLLTWSDQLQQLDFQEMILFLQTIPTKNWTHQELEMVLSRAFMWRVMFDRSPSHLNSG